MKRDELVLVALSPARGGLHTPVQIQKLLFLIDRNIPQYVGGPHFDFKPWSYGPFDGAVYEELEKLIRKDYVEICQEHTWNSYRLTSKGQLKGANLLKSLDPVARIYIRNISGCVRNLTFSELVSTIYKAYPDMQRNSVF